MALLLFAIHELERRAHRNERIFRRRYDAFEISDELFMANFRLTKHAAQELILSLSPHLTESHRLPAHIKVLTALRFYASGSYQRSVGNDIFLAISQKSVHISLKEVTEAINNHLMQEMIQFPHGDEVIENKRAFYAKCGLSGVIGAIDCTHIAIIAPTDDPPAVQANQYMNRKRYYSINVQLICDLNLKILNINARYPGCVHDAFIFKNSAVREHLRIATAANGSYGWLVGDSGYPLEQWLLTPYLDVEPGSLQDTFNRHHARARNCIERCIGVLKNRFRCLLKHRALHYDPSTAGKIINACATLHNWCLHHRVPEPQDQDIEPEDDVNTSEDDSEFDNVAVRMREDVVRNLQ